MLLERLYRWRLALTLASVGGLAAALRFVGLGSPREVIFDELHYARGAYSLMTLGYEANWAEDDVLLADGGTEHLKTSSKYVVHPPLGPGLISLGLRLFGVTPVGWRFSSAVIGTLTVILLIFVARHVLRSTLWGGLAGVFLAIDGQHIVASRTALLDIFLTFFVLLGFALLLLDRHWARRRLGARVDDARSAAGLAAGAALPGIGPGVGFRWWRLAALVSLGLSVGIKWSGLYFAAALLVLAVIWDLVDRRRAGVQRWFLGTVARSAAPAFVVTMVVVPTVYLAAWTSWYQSDEGYYRHWAEEHPGEGVTWLPESTRSLVEYHGKMYGFHRNLTEAEGYSHDYASKPQHWPLQLHPTLYYFETAEDDAEIECGGSRCTSVVHGLGNPALWWAGTLALGYALWRVARRGDLVALTVATGTLAGWLPWFLSYDRIMFTFYSVSFAPWVMLTLAWALQRLAQPDGPSGAWSRRGTTTVVAFTGTAFVLSGFFWPIWTGQWIPYRYWGIHLWLGDFWI